MRKRKTMKLSLALAGLLLASSSFAQQPPAAKPAAPPAPKTAPAPTPAPAALPAGAKIAYVNIQQIVQASAEGKADNAKVDVLVKKKQAEAPANQKTPQDAQRFQQQAQAEVQQLQQELQADFQRKLMPILQKLAQDNHLSMLLSSQDARVIP